MTIKSPMVIKKHKKDKIYCTQMKTLVRHDDAALSVRPDVLNAKNHVITNATYSYHNRDPVPAKFKHVTNIETCTLSMLWSYHIVESSGCKHGGKQCSLLWQKRQNSSKISMDRLIKEDKKVGNCHFVQTHFVQCHFVQRHLVQFPISPIAI